MKTIIVLGGGEEPSLSDRKMGAVVGPTDEEEDFDPKGNPLWYDKNGNTYMAFNMKGILFWNYYLCYVSLFLHMSTHAFFLGMWCNYSKVVILYSFQVFLLHAYSWAIPDRKYAYWVQQHYGWFIGLSGLNIMFYLLGLSGGAMLYRSSSDGLMQYMGVSCVMYTFLSQTLMILMFAVNYTTLRQRFAYEENGYHGHVEYPPKQPVPAKPQPMETQDDEAAITTLLI